MNSEVKIPISIAMYFIATKNKISIDKACAYLIKSLDGDSHYLTVEFVEDGMLSMDLAEIIYMVQLLGNAHIKIFLSGEMH